MTSDIEPFIDRVIAYLATAVPGTEIGSDVRELDSLAERALKRAKPRTANNEIEHPTNALRALAIMVSESGRTLSLEGKPAEAIERFREAFEIDPRYRDSSFQLAWHLSNAGQMHKALEHYLNLLMTEPGDGHVWCNAGCIFAFMKHFSLARIFLNAAIKMDPVDQVARKTLNSLPRR